MLLRLELLSCSVHRYTAQTLRNKTYGPAMDFVWSSVGTGDYCIKESSSKIKTFKNFKDGVSIKPRHCSAEQLFGGPVIAVRGSDCVVFYDWEELKIIRKIEVVPKNVIWSDSGDLVVLACEDSFFVLKYDKEVVAAGTEWDDEDGVKGAFDLLHEIGENVGSGQWVGDCFVYTNSANRLNYYVGGETMTICHLETTMFMLGYLPKENRVYLIDKNSNIVSFTVLQSLLEYQTFVVRGDFETANEILPSIPKDQYGAVAQFLESQGFKEEALQVTPDNDQKFDLALQLGKLELATDIMQEIGVNDTTDSQYKWKQLGDMALAASNIKLMEECALNSGDLSGLLLLYSSLGDGEGMKRLAHMALTAKKNNVAFLCMFLTHDLEGCVKLLADTKRLPEAAFMARTYLPSQASEIVQLWKTDLASVSDQASQALADPNAYPELFPDLEYAVKAEEMFKASRDRVVPSGAYPQAKADLNLNLIEEMKKLGHAGKASLRDFAAEAKEQRRFEEERLRQVEEAKKGEAALKAKAEAERLRAERMAKRGDAPPANVEKDAEAAQKMADREREAQEKQLQAQAEAHNRARQAQHEKEVQEKQEAQRATALLKERQEGERRKQEEEHRKQEERRKQEEEHRKLEEERRKQEDERQRQELAEKEKLKAEKERKAREAQEAKEAEERRCGI
jgi:coatomer subunit beta'